MLSEARAEGLRDILGAEGLIVDPPANVAYNRGGRGDAGRAAFVARPSSVEQVSKTLAYCFQERIELVPQGGNTGLVKASVADGSGNQGILSLDRLARHFELDRENRSLRVDAGFRLSEINQRLSQHGLFFPIDLGSDPQIGGMLATNTGGSRFMRYGDVRRNTLGLKAVLADRDGTVLDLARALRKNNTGVDWKQLFIGTSGYFGVIVECVVSLEPLPRQTAAALIVPHGIETVAQILAALEDAFGSYLSAFEIMSGAAIRRTLHHIPALRDPFPDGAPDYAIMVELTRSWPTRPGEQPLANALQDVLSGLWECEEPALLDALMGSPEHMWALRHAIPEGLRTAGHLVAFDLSFGRGKIAPFLLHMRGQLPVRFPGVEICDFGHFGDGGIHFNLVLPHDDGRCADAVFLEELQHFVTETAVEQFEGSYSGEHGIGRKNQRDYDRYTSQTERRLAGALKLATSPATLGGIRLT